MRELETATSANLVATPTLVHVRADAAELNGSRYNSILAHEQAQPSAEPSYIGGGHSETGRQELCGAVFRGWKAP